MKKIWRCPHCAQFSTRHGNLKRHIERKHNAIGKPNLEYVSGNSIFNPTITPRHSYLIQDEDNVFRKPWKDDIFYSNTSHMKNSDDVLDKNLDRIFRLVELQTKLKSINQSLNMNPVKYFPRLPTQLYSGFIGNPIYNTFNEIPGYQNKISLKLCHLIAAF